MITHRTTLHIGSSQNESTQDERRQNNGGGDNFSNFDRISLTLSVRLKKLRTKEKKNVKINKSNELKRKSRFYDFIISLNFTYALMKASQSVRDT